MFFLPISANCSCLGGDVSQRLNAAFKDQIDPLFGISVLHSLTHIY